MSRKLNTLPRKPPEVMNPKLDADIVRVLMKCIERDRAERYPTVVAFKDALVPLRTAGLLMPPLVPNRFLVRLSHPCPYVQGDAGNDTEAAERLRRPAGVGPAAQRSPRSTAAPTSPTCGSPGTTSASACRSP